MAPQALSYMFAKFDDKFDSNHHGIWNVYTDYDGKYVIPYEFDDKTSYGEHLMNEYYKGRRRIQLGLPRWLSFSHYSLHLVYSTPLTLLYWLTIMSAIAFETSYFLGQETTTKNDESSYLKSDVCVHFQSQL